MRPRMKQAQMMSLSAHAAVWRAGAAPSCMSVKHIAVDKRVNGAFAKLVSYGIVSTF